MKWLDETVTLPQKVMVTDPGYDSKMWCNESVGNVLPGKYRIYIQLNREGRVKLLQVTHEDYLENKSHSRHEQTGSCGVDSGTRGIFDEEYFLSNAPSSQWYDDHVLSWCCQSTFHVCESKGVASESGYGDGYYPLYTAVNNNNKVVSFKILFI